LSLVVFSASRSLQNFDAVAWTTEKTAGPVKKPVLIIPKDFWDTGAIMEYLQKGKWIKLVVSLVVVDLPVKRHS